MSMAMGRDTNGGAVAGTQEAEGQRRHRIGGWRAASFTLGMELFERLAFFGIVLNLVTYLHEHMGLSIPRSANIVTNFIGASYLTSLLGGFVADAYLGRYWSTVLGCIIQLPGMVLMMLTAMLTALNPEACDKTKSGSNCPEASGRQLGVLYLALCLIACGVGAVKSSVSGLGADQFDEGGRQMHSYFNWFTFSISAGGMLAVTVLVYLQDHAGRSIGYSISVVCLLVALFLLLIGYQLFHRKPPCGSAFVLIAHVFVAALRNRHLPYSPPMTSSLSSQFSFLNKATIMPFSNNKARAQQSPWRCCSSGKVEDVKMLIRLLPILATTIVYWTANAQMFTFSIEQGVTLDRRLGKNFEIPAASFGMFLQLGIFLMTLFYDLVIIPLARKWRHNEYGITSLQRIAIGLMISIVSMAIAALVEKKRLKIAHSFEAERGANIERLPMSIFYLTPQFFLVGVGQAFAYVGQLDFFYKESPLGMRSLSTGLCMSPLSFGFFLSSALVSCVNSWTRHGSHDGWLSHDLDHGRLDYFYWFLAVISFVSFLAYLLCANWYKYNNHSVQDMRDNQSSTGEEKIITSPISVN